ncbi:MAG: Asp23/Gls24 family envelope stress response protein [Lachnospiraceae bacterium]|nr:Asp23/Gls24 family envelope stress response protein [Lachnospiraceae bacterium]MDD7147339.1 Asp23/Gls24 family envelope stress response protein [Lachnospiraceae bacterium]MDY4068335.1 Asp23/Gls24 family envelope stress response protein [Lachnospiraceae bacterium]
MEKEMENKTYSLEGSGSIGEVRIADDVVAMIAGYAALETDGVSSLAGNATGELLNRVGVKTLQKGAKVEVVDHVVSVELAVILCYGYNIPATSSKIQEKVKSAIETMTGLEVSDVNIRIAGVEMDK